MRIEDVARDTEGQSIRPSLLLSAATAPAHVAVDEVEDPDARFYAMQLRGASNAKVKHELGLRPRRREWLGGTQ